MCGRLALFSDPITLARHFGLTGTFTVAPRWNIAPGPPPCIVRQARGLDPLRPPAPALLDGACARRVRARRVSRQVNSPAHDGSELLAAAADSRP